MAKVSEEISKANTTSQGRTDANLAQDSNHLGGIAAEEYATKKYVQDYHDTKETAQKSYIDQQDQAMLNQAKEYTNSQIRNQDFSEFAKVTDVQALDQKLSGEMETGLTAQKNYTDEKTQAIVDDVNANFEDVNGAISTLNGNVNNLFQSVSNGKSQIAEAITDKGVSTSANDSFSTMASNIRAIPSGSGGGSGGEGGETDPNYVNTSDATATASDILLGKTAYAQGQKVHGTLIAQADEGYPTFGTDTSNATAVASDIAYGKTAYARGQFLVGTATSNVEEIYGISSESFDIDEISFATNKPPDGKGKISSIENCIFSQNGNYCVRQVEVNSTSYIESFAINDDGLYYQASKNATSDDVEYKKYRYTYSELGITGTISCMALSSPGFGGDSQKCILAIISETGSGTSYKQYLRLLTYHLNDEGIIGKAYENETNYIDESIKLEEAYGGSGYTYKYERIIGDLNNPLKFYMLNHHSTRYGHDFRLDACNINSVVNENDLTYIASENTGTSIDSDNAIGYITGLKITEDNKYCYALFTNNYSNKTTAMVESLMWNIDSGISPTSGKKINVSTSSINRINNKLFLFNVNCSQKDGDYLQLFADVYEIIEDGTNFNISEQCRRVWLTNDGDYTYDLRAEGNISITNDGKRMVCVYGRVSPTNAVRLENTTVAIFNVENILSVTVGGVETIDAEQVYLCPYSINISSEWKSNIQSNRETSKFFKIVSYNSGDYCLIGIMSAENTENIVGIIYKNKYFSYTESQTSSETGGKIDG